MNSKSTLDLPSLQAAANELPAESCAAIFEEKFGDPKPIPPAAIRMPSYVQEAARLFIHEAKSYEDIRDILGLNTEQMKKVQYSKNKHKWAQFMGVLSATLRPSMLLSIEPHNLRKIQREKARRDELLPKYEKEESRLLDLLINSPPGSKAYKEISASLEMIRKTIEKYTCIAAYEDEQSFARKKLMEKKLDFAMEDGAADREHDVGILQL